MQKAPARRSVSTGSLADSRSSCSVAKRSTACVQTHVLRTLAIHHDYGEILLSALSERQYPCGARPRARLSLCFVGCPTASLLKCFRKTCYCKLGWDHKRACLAPSAALAMTALVLQAALSCH